LEGKIKELEDELLKLKSDFDHLEIVYKASSDFDSSKPINCENCDILQKKVNYLITTASKLSMGTTNLNAILGSQNCVYEKVGIRYQTGFQGKQKKFSSFFKSNEQQFTPFMTCYYCMSKQKKFSSFFKSNEQQFTPFMTCYYYEKRPFG